MSSKRLLSLISISILLTSCSITGTQKRDWKFVQSVGGIKTGMPLDTYDNWYLPIEFNVTGLDSITIKPTAMNSALECSGVDVDKCDSLIFLTVKTGLIGRKSHSTFSKAVNIGKLKNRKYYVYYKYKNTTNFIDTFRIQKIPILKLN